MSFSKTILRGLAVFCLLTFISVTPVLASTQGVVTGDNVNIRTEASTNSEILTKVNSGQALNIIGKEGDFFQIRFDGGTYYITSEFVDITRIEGDISGSRVNVREYPTTEADVVAKVSDGDAVTILGRSGGWYKVEADGSDGYIREDFLSGWALSYARNIDAPQMPVTQDPVVQENEDRTENQSRNQSDEEVFEEKRSSSRNSQTVKQVMTAATSDTYAVVNATGLRLRETPSLEGEILEKVRAGAVLDVVEYNNDWVNVVYNGKPGYVSAEFVFIGTGDKPEKYSPKAQEIIDYGKQFLGTPYVYAGNDLSSGVDCSGFVYNVFKQFGIDLYRSSRDMVNDGYAVHKTELIPGDLVFFDTNGGANNGDISHVGIYMGGGQFIHSSSSTRTWGVVISSLYDDYYIRTYVSACRVLD